MLLRHFTGLLIILILGFIPFTSQAQFEDEEFYYGFIAGVSRSSLDDVKTTLIRPIFPSETYKTSNLNRWGVVIGSFVHYRFKNSHFAIEPQILYQDGGGEFHYEDIEDLTYDITFNYAHLKIAPIIKYYLAAGAFIQLGPELGLIIDRSALKYNSSQPDLGPDLQIQQSLSEVLKGNNNISLMMGAGYDMPFGLGIDIRYNFGISDAMETIANGFYFVENKNIQHSMAIAISYVIPFDR